MNCEFKDKSQKCYFIKTECKNEDFKNCKYYQRQYPKDKETFDIRFQQALNKAISNRNFLKGYQEVLNKIEPEYDKSIYLNIKRVLDQLDSFSIQKKEKRPISKSDLEGDILKNIATNLYNTVEIKVLMKDDKNNSIVIEEKGNKYVCKIKLPISDFFEKLLNSKRKADFFNEQIIDKRNIKS